MLDAMRKQMERMTFAPPLHGIADITLDFVERLGAVAPPGLTFVKGFSGGSEANEAAIKFVRQYFKQTGCPNKYKFISRYHGYHGSTGAAMSASGTGVRKTKFEPHMAGFLKVFPPTHYRRDFSSWDECNRYAARTIEDVIVHEDPETVAGVIVEPIGNTGGIITPTEEYFRIIREICDRYNVVLIFDEVITGFGKTGAMFASQSFGVTPDIICCGKGISNGAIPLGAMIARQSMAEAFLGPAGSNRQFAHGNTFAGNPLACAVGIAVLDTLRSERGYASVHRSFWATVSPSAVGDFEAIWRCPRDPRPRRAPRRGIHEGRTNAGAVSRVRRRAEAHGDRQGCDPARRPKLVCTLPCPGVLGIRT